MSTTYLCTTGTSIAQGTPSLREYQQRETTWDEPADDLAADIRERLASLDLSDAEARRRASAEINSLNRMGLNAEDRVILFVTDTADGRVCAEAVAGILRARIEQMDGSPPSWTRQVRRITFESVCDDEL